MIGIIVVAIRTELRGKLTRVNHEKTQAAIKTVEIMVNGPLGAALKSTADALTHVAHLTGTSSDILAAVAASKMATEHEQQTLLIENFKKVREANLKKPRTL